MMEVKMTLFYALPSTTCTKYNSLYYSFDILNA